MATDLEKAERLVRRSGSFVGPHGTMRKNIAKVVADGIAVGRREGLEMAIDVLKKELQTAKSN